MPLPTTSAIDKPEAAAERDCVEAVATDTGGGLPRCRDLAAVDLGHHVRKELALYPPRFVQLPALERYAMPPGAAVLDLRSKRGEQLARCPRAFARSP